MDNTVLVIGANGQLGSYLSEFFLNKDYNVIGLVRRNSSNNKERIRDILHYKNFHLVESDILDLSSLIQTLSINKPQQIYNTAAQSHVGTSFTLANYTFDVVANGVLNLLEAIRISGIDTRLLQYSSSEIFGDQVEQYYRVVGGCDGFPLVEFFKGQRESTMMNPVSPYSVAKLAAYNLVRMYRKSYSMFASNIIMFNTESPKRGENFVTKKITKYIGALNRCNHKELFPRLKLGNINAYRDWSYVKDNVEASYAILNHTKADCFVVGTGTAFTIKDFLRIAFEMINEKWEDYVEIDQSLYRPLDVEYLCADTTKIEKELGWKSKTKFYDLVKIMVDHDIQEK